MRVAQNRQVNKLVSDSYFSKNLDSYRKSDGLLEMKETLKTDFCNGNNSVHLDPSTSAADLKHSFRIPRNQAPCLRPFRIFGNELELACNIGSCGGISLKNICKSKVTRLHASTSQMPRIRNRGYVTDFREST